MHRHSYWSINSVAPSKLWKLVTGSGHYFKHAFVALSAVMRTLWFPHMSLSLTGYTISFVFVILLTTWVSHIAWISDESTEARNTRHSEHSIINRAVKTTTNTNWNSSNELIACVVCEPVIVVNNAAIHTNKWNREEQARLQPTRVCDAG
jgi:dipeptide/tripeptide permease